MPDNIRIAVSDHGEAGLTFRDVSLIAIDLRDLSQITRDEVMRDESYAYFEPGPEPFVPQPGEVVFDHYPTPEEIAEAFPDAEPPADLPSLVIGGAR